MTYAVPNSSVAGPAAAPVAPPADRLMFGVGLNGAPVAVRGFLDRDGSVADALGVQACTPAPVAGVASGKAGVDLSVQLNELRQSQVAGSVQRQAAGRKLVELGGVWTDTDLDAKAKVVRVKAMSAAYFRILAKQPNMSEVFRLGSRIAWVAPSGAVLVIDPAAGEEKMSDAEIDALFVAKQ
jgi:hypothetical protein